jgi:hypothetical protein
MSPDDLAIVDRSWAELQPLRDSLVASLSASLPGCDLSQADARARWLIDSVTELVGLLRAPSDLAAAARRRAAMFPCDRSGPTFSVDGRAFLRAAAAIGPSWSPRDDSAWRQAWLLLADVLAEQSLSPFADPQSK